MNGDSFKNLDHILCVRPDNLGDVLMAQPAIRALKEDRPGRRITLLTSRMGSGVARMLPEVDEVITYTLPWVKNDGLRDSEAGVMGLIDAIRKKKFEAAVIFTNFSQSAFPTVMLCYLAGIPRRLAYVRENPYRLLTDWVPDPEPFFLQRHAVERLLALVGSVGVPARDRRVLLTAGKEAEEAVKRKLKEGGVDLDKRWLVIHPGVSERKRRYPPALFAETARLIRKKLGYQICLTGLEAESATIREIERQSRTNIISLAGLLSLSELVALIKLSPLLIANNTGPMHIASAVGTPVVALYARTNPEHTPWMVRHKVLYFDVEKDLRSPNQVLKFIEPSSTCPLPTPDEILRAAAELLVKN